MINGNEEGLPAYAEHQLVISFSCVGQLTTEMGSVQSMQFDLAQHVVVPANIFELKS